METVVKVCSQGLGTSKPHFNMQNFVNRKRIVSVNFIQIQVSASLKPFICKKTKNLFPISFR